jgi:hypothetical protein
VPVSFLASLRLNSFLHLNFHLKGLGQQGALGEEEREQRKVNKQIDEQLQKVCVESLQVMFAVSLGEAGPSSHTSVAPTGRWRVRQVNYS